MIHPVTVTATVPTGTVALEDHVLIGATITMGADGLWDDPDPATLSMEIMDPTGTWRQQLAFTSTITVTTAGTTRFTGTITDMRVTWENGVGWVLGVICVGPKVAARTLLVESRPQETAAERVAAVWATAGLTVHDVDYTGSVAVLPATQPATVSTMAKEAAHADLGLIANRRDGSLWYRGRDAIAASQLVKAVLPADGVFPDSQWVKSIGEMSTRVICGYGTASPQDTVAVTDLDLEVELGRVAEYVHSGAYVDNATATAIATEALSRRAAPAWRTTALHIDLALPAYNAGRTADVLALESGDVVWVTGAPAATPAGTSETYVVLGWSETLDGARHELNLRVVEDELLRDTARWGNVAMTWFAAGATPIGDYNYTPPTLDPGITP